MQQQWCIIVFLYLSVSVYLSHAAYTNYHADGSGHDFLTDQIMNMNSNINTNVNGYLNGEDQTYYVAGNIRRHGFFSLIIRALILLPAYLLSRIGLIQVDTVARIASSFVELAVETVRRSLEDTLL